MGLRSFALSHGPNFLKVHVAAAALEQQLLKYRRGSYGIDLAADPDDATKADPVMAAAVMRLLKKYGDQLVVSRFRERTTLSWRAGTFGAVDKENRQKLEAVGFYVGADATYEEIRSGIDPMQIGDPRAKGDAQKRHDENRRARVRTWARKGWQGDAGWAAWGGDPETVKRSAEYAEYQREQLAKLGGTNIGGVDVKIVDEHGAPIK